MTGTPAAVTTTKDSTLRFPGISHASTAKLNELLEKNHKLDIFFDGVRHNHTAHILLACYSLGATAEELQTQYDYHLSVQRALSPLHYDDPHASLLNQGEFGAHLGDPKYFHDYLVFYTKEIELHGFDAAFKKHFTNPKVFVQSHNGILHGLIHVGYALEFRNNLVLAEGLALCSTQPPDYDASQPIFSNWLLDRGLAPQPNHPGKATSVLDILDTLHANRAQLGFETARPFTMSDAIGYDRVTSDKSAKFIEATCSQWHLEADEKVLKSKFLELSKAIVYAYATTMPSRDDGAAYFDFFILHALTSCYFMPLILRHFSIEQQVAVLQFYMRHVSVVYLIAGAPKVNRSWLDDEDGNEKEADERGVQAWWPVIKSSINFLDLHLVKAVRTLVMLDSQFGQEDPNHIFYKAARLTALTFKRPYPWCFGIGYDKPVFYDVPRPGENFQRMLDDMSK
ncbi:hypothetical protein BC940DRAFT_309197 [Gongronella butleri]|nr:hypothetical protein BC940DRAFT_309197 [Gongronella butleri]